MQMQAEELKGVQVCWKGQDEGEEEESSSPKLYGDILEATFSFVPLVDLVPACGVSKSWRRSVFSSLANLNKIKPWFLVHVQNKVSCEPRTSYGYDPRSDVWVQIDPPLTKHASTTLRSSASNLLYTLSSSTLSFSTDPLHTTWRQVDGPATCRIDPIVALCGSRIVVAGSGWDFEDDPLAVEVYDLESSTWRRCESMPDILKDSASATWLSVASNHSAMFVTEKASGVTYSFDPVAGTWRGPYDLRPDPRVVFSAVGFVGEEELIVAGLITGQDDGSPEGLRLWKVNRETMGCEAIGEAPAGIMDKLKPGKEMEICAVKGLVYIYNRTSEGAGELDLVYCQIISSGVCMWGSARKGVWEEEVRIGGRMVFTCGTLEMPDLQAAIRSQNRKFVVLG